MNFVVQVIAILKQVNALWPPLEPNVTQESTVALNTVIQVNNSVPWHLWIMNAQTLLSVSQNTVNSTWMWDLRFVPYFQISMIVETIVNVNPLTVTPAPRSVHSFPLIMSAHLTHSAGQTTAASSSANPQLTQKSQSNPNFR